MVAAYDASPHEFTDRNRSNSSMVVSSAHRGPVASFHTLRTVFSMGQSECSKRSFTDELTADEPQVSYRKSATHSMESDSPLVFSL